MKLRMSLLAILVIVTGILPLGAEQLTTVAVVDLERVLNQFFTQSQAVRAWQDDVESFDQQRRHIEQEITDLEDQRLNALNQGDDTRALRLEDQIDQRRGFLEEFIRIRRSQLERQREDLLAGDAGFYSELNAAMAFVAQNEGYTIIIDAAQRGLLWYSDQVDMTSEVINRLRQTLQ